MRSGLIFTLLSVAVLGCDNGPSLVPVTGRVVLDGKPVEGASVRLVGEGIIPPLANDLSATTAADGSFVPNYRYGDDGVPAGRYKVGIVQYAVDNKNEGMRTGPNLLPTRYADPASSGLTVEVPAEGGDLTTIELTSRK